MIRRRRWALLLVLLVFPLTVAGDHVPRLVGAGSCGHVDGPARVCFELTPAPPDSLSGGADELRAVEWCLDYDPDVLGLDCDDRDADGLADGVELVAGDGFAGTARCTSDPSCPVRLSVAPAGEAETLLPSGPLVCANLEVRPDAERGVPVAVSTVDAWATDRLGVGIPVEATATDLAVATCCTADCNADGQVNVADAVSVLLEVADGDGASSCDTLVKVPYAGTSCCDCNGDLRVDIGDAVCISGTQPGQACRPGALAPGSPGEAVAIRGGNLLDLEMAPTACSGPDCGPIRGAEAGGGAGPVLSFGAAVPAVAGESAVMPLSLTQGDDDGVEGGPDDITAWSACVDFDQTGLTFDTSDSDGDGVPTAINFVLPPSHTGLATIDLARDDCEIFLSAIDLIVPLTVLPEGVNVEIEFDVVADPPQVPVVVGCGNPLALSFSDRFAVSQPGSCESGAFVLGCQIDEDCSDGLFCNGEEVCGAGGVCQPGDPVDPDDGVSCTVDSCDEATDTIVNEPADNLCDDGAFCNGAETCDPVNDCQAGEPVDPDDGVSCTVDSCDEATDTIVNEPADNLCDDGAFCNGAETCDPVNDCQAGEPVDPDDGVSCTVDSCDEATDTIVNEPADNLCDDGAFCNGAETCDPVNDCQAGEPVDPDDGVSCTVDSCDETTDTIVNEPADNLCDDGAFCNGAETCDPVNDCQAGEPVDPDDGVSCTVDSCDEATDTIVNEPADNLCDDGAFCNGAETCDPVNDCQAGEPVDPDDGVSCTVDSCDEATDTIVNEPADNLCDDGAFCNGAETCDPVNDCQAGEPVDPDDGVSCTVDSCDEATDTIVNEPADNLCDDGAFCNGAETCDPVNDCQAGEPVDPDDGVSCTVDSCDEATDTIVNEPADNLCDDGAFCNGAETCDPVNDCQAGEPVDPDDGVSCTVDSCDEATDTIVNEPADNLCDDGAFCNGAETCDPVNDCQAGEPVDPDDGVSCTVDSCDEATDTIVNEPADNLCDDGAFCNGAETCDPVNDCQAGEPVDPDDGVSCTVDSCDEATDTIVNEPADNLCDDGAFCNGAETCDPVNDCQAGEPVDPDDGVSCTVDSCDEATDTIVNEPADNLCDDGAFCNGAETCDPVNDCQAGEPVDPDDGVSCTVDSCDEATDRVLNVPDDTVCDDGAFCNGAEVCDPERDCSRGTRPPVDDGVSCTLDSCDEVNDTIVHEPIDRRCDDGAFCNGVETCDLVNDCQAGDPPPIDDGVSCTVDACDELNDAIVHEPADDLCDDGAFCNGAETCDPVSDCQAGDPPPIDDGVSCTVDSCDEATDTIVHEPADSLCDDGAFCNGAEICDPVEDCRAGTPPPVDDGVSCTLDACDEAADEIVHIPDDAVCDDGDPGNGEEFCDPLDDCQPGEIDDEDEDEDQDDEEPDDEDRDDDEDDDGADEDADEDADY